MDFKNLHLEEAVVLPENYREIILERREITPELKAQGFGGGVWGKDRRYNSIYRDIEPFFFRVIEDNVDSSEPGVLQYQFEFKVDNSAFTPYLKFIKEWGKEHGGKGSKLNERFATWLLSQCDLPKETDGNLLYRIPTNTNDVSFILESETDFLIVLKEISKAFRTLATDHASDPFDLAAEFEYDPAELRGMGYWDMANRILTPMVLRGLIEGLAAYRQKAEAGETTDPAISIEVKKKAKTMLFYHGDRCKGTPFCEFEIGPVLTKCLGGIRDEGLKYEAELSHWFTDAAGSLPEKAVAGLRVSIEVPETGGDPVFEN